MFRMLLSRLTPKKRKKNRPPFGSSAPLLMAQVFGEENGIGVRSAAGMILQSNIPVEVEAMFELY